MRLNTKGLSPRHTYTRTSKSEYVLGARDQLARGSISFFLCFSLSSFFPFVFLFIHYEDDRNRKRVARRQAGALAGPQSS